MKKLLLHIWIPILYTMLLFAGCNTMTGAGGAGQYIVNVVGAPVVLNCSKSYTLAGYYANEDWDTVSLVASAGDLLYFQLTDEEILRVFRELYETMLEGMQRVLEEGVASGEFREIPAREVSQFLLVTWEGLFFHSMLGVGIDWGPMTEVMQMLLSTGLRKEDDR